MACLKGSLAANKDKEIIMSESNNSFESLLMKISASFINVTSKELDDCIKNALKDIVLFLEVDRGTVGQFIPAKGKMQVTHSFAVEGINPLPNTIGEKEVPALTRQIRKHEPYFFDSLDDLPANAAVDKKFGESMGVKSFAAVPLAIAGTPLGVVSFGSIRKPHKWAVRTISRLQLLGEVFANALLRDIKEKELIGAYNKINHFKERAELENIAWREHSVSHLDHFSIIGKSAQLQEVLRMVEQVAHTNSTVLILGETGTGKERIATAVHKRSSRKNLPLVRVNCAALAPGLIESELFGHEKGAFTGALEKRQGRFALADGGTLVLDEIGELDLGLQAKLLRVLQEGTFEPIGSSETVQVDVRIIASTNRDIEAMVSEGTFRQDLFYRLGVFPIVVPPLRERKEDIPLLVTYFVGKLGLKLGRTIKEIPEHVFETLSSYDWPGNIRELRNLIERSMIISSSSTFIVHGLGIKHGQVPKVSVNKSDIDYTLAEVDRRHIISVCEYCGWKVEGASGAAKILDINPNTLRSRMKKLGISRPGKL